MKSSAILALIVAVLGLFAASSMARSDLYDLRVAAEIIEEQVIDNLVHARGESNGLSPPDCCNQCGACDFRPPQFARCQCLDPVTKCHPRCKNCVKSPLTIYPPVYSCLDIDFVSYLTCGKKCEVDAAFKSIIN